MRRSKKAKVREAMQSKKKYGETRSHCPTTTQHGEVEVAGARSKRATQDKPVTTSTTTELRKSIWREHQDSAKSGIARKDAEKDKEQEA